MRKTLLEVCNEEYDKQVKPLLETLQEIVELTKTDGINSKAKIRNKAEKLIKTIQEGFWK